MTETPTPDAVTLDQVANKLDTLCEKASALFVRYGKADRGPRLYTVEEVADALNIKKRSVEDLLRSGRLPHVNVSVSGSHLKPRRRVSEDDLIAFIESRRAKPPIPHADRRRRRRRPLG